MNTANQRLLARIFLDLGENQADIRDDLSAATIDAAGHLWLAGDEPIDDKPALVRLTAEGPLQFAQGKPFPLTDFFDLPAGEVDLETLDATDDYLWFAGSHARARKRPKSKFSLEKNLDRLATVSSEPARAVLGRIPLTVGQLAESIDPPGGDDPERVAGILPFAEGGNLLTTALEADPHLRDFIGKDIASKENGLDIEGLAVSGSRLFLGLRGPVLRGFAILIELEFDTNQSGRDLALRTLNEDRPYRKHFVHLNGHGIRDLAFDDEDLILIAGPTMAANHPATLYRLRDALDFDGDSIVFDDDKRLEAIMDIPDTAGADKAEGLVVTRFLSENAVLIVYDTPADYRRVGKDGVFADVFRLES